MNKEELKKQVKTILSSMGYTNITFSNGEENVLRVTFNAEELTSFKTELTGWAYSGIQLDPTDPKRYMIEFRRTS